MKRIILSIFAMSLLIVSCSEDNDDNISTEPLGAYEDGIIVSGEGGPSSISFKFISMLIMKLLGCIYNL